MKLSLGGRAGGVKEEPQADITGVVDDYNADERCKAWDCTRASVQRESSRLNLKP